MKPSPSSPCPVCKKPTEEQFRPFCSARCKDIDLGRWFTGAYAVPVEEEEQDILSNETSTKTEDNLDEREF